MHYRDGQPVHAGDEVLIWRERPGKVVCSFDTREFSESYPEQEWGHMRDGVLVLAETGELFHLLSADEDVELRQPTSDRWREGTG